MPKNGQPRIGGTCPSCSREVDDLSHESDGEWLCADCCEECRADAQEGFEGCGKWGCQECYPDDE